MAKRFMTIFTVMAFILVVVFVFSYQKKIFLISNAEEGITSEKATFLVLGKTGKVIGWNVSPELADSIFVVDYHPQIGAANIVSLPRDLYVTLGGESFKLNEVLKRNKLNDLMRALPEITGLRTDKYVVVDIDFVKNFVEELGGVDVELEKPLVDWVSGYTIPSGSQHLNGEQVAWAVRNRFGPQGDFFREKNQHEIIRGLVRGFKDLNIFQKTSFIFKMTPEMSKLQTNIDFQEFIPLADKFNGARFNNVVLDFNTGLLYSGYIDITTSQVVDRNATTTPSATSSALTATSSTSTISSVAYVLIPRKGANKYEEIKDFIEGKLEK